MATEGWFPTWFSASYFPPVWFAPADESHLTDDELRPEYRGSGKASGSRVPSKPSDDDLIRQVIDKWEVIEAARALDEIRASEGATHAPEPGIDILPPGVNMAVASLAPSAVSESQARDLAAAHQAEIDRHNNQAIKLATALFDL